jgi:hypothetical protein
VLGPTEIATMTDWRVMGKAKEMRALAGQGVYLMG